MRGREEYSPRTHGLVAAMRRLNTHRLELSLDLRDKPFVVEQASAQEENLQVVKDCYDSCCGSGRTLVLPGLMTL